MNIFTIACLLMALASGFSSARYTLDLNLDEEWESFKQQYRQGEEYGNKESARKAIFEENLRKIKIHNYLHSKGLKSFEMAVNKFADMTSEEISSRFNGFKRSDKGTVGGSSFLGPLNGLPLPKELDWRTKGYVTPVKNQGQCGSCWAFSVTGAIEGQHFRKTGKLVSLSEQQLVDCSTGNNGCHGGWPSRAFEYVKDAGGIDTEESYPYNAGDFECKFNNNTVGATVTGYIEIPKGNEDELLSAVATVGPISIAIDVSINFDFYKKGILDDHDCDPTELDHAVLLVGYGTEDGKDYWLVKNSWGKDWGMDGYIKMSRNKNNQCGIASEAMYPLV